MASKMEKSRDDVLHPSNLTADKRGPTDLFTCDVADAVLKDLMPTLEHPFYSLSKKPMMAERIYRRGDNWLKVSPSAKGMATIYDKDLLIYAVSQLVAAIRDGAEPKQRVRINCRDFLMFANRGQGGKDYQAICDAIERLDGTRITTNIKTGDEEQFDAFGLIDGGTVRRKDGLNGRILWVEIKLSDFVFNAIRHHEVLTLHPDYFRLAKPLERRIYELARRHCGQQASWSPYMKTLFEKSGSTGSLKLFRSRVKEICKINNMPDYELEFRAAGDQVVFMNRETMPLDRDHKEGAGSPAAGVLPMLQQSTYEKARKAAPSWDVYALENEWRVYAADRGECVKSVDAAFVGFCKARFAKMGRP